MKSTRRTQEHAALAFAKAKPLLRARDVMESGVPTVLLSRLVAKGKLIRVARGVYSLPNAKISEHRSLVEVAIRVPNSVICLLSALCVHDIGTQLPFQVWLAIAPRRVTPRLDQPNLRVVRMSDAALNSGVERIEVGGVQVAVFNAAKTATDCFKFRNKVGLDVALEARRDGWRHRKFTMDQLWWYAEVNRVANVRRPYLEGLVG